MKTTPTTNREKIELMDAADEVLQSLLEAVVNTNGFNRVVDGYGENWTQTMTIAAFNPETAEKDLTTDLKNFFERMEITTDMVIEWIVDAVVCSPEFQYCIRNVPVDEENDWEEEKK